LTRVFADTSALYALLVGTDVNHSAAAQVFSRLQRDQSSLITSSYVLIETYALLGRRVGRPAMASFRSGFAPLLDVVWVDASLHEAALDLLFARKGADVSLVDAVSFLLISRERIEGVFAYDRHFAVEGFTVL
jgi:uncharacterized protein